MFNQGPFFTPFSSFGMAPNYGAMMPSMGNAAGFAPMMGRTGGLSSLFGRGGGLRSLFGQAGGAGNALGGVAGATRTGVNWSGLLSGAQRTLGVINQAIPAINQIRPFWNNARSILSIVKAFNKSNNDDPKSESDSAGSSATASNITNKKITVNNDIDTSSTSNISTNNMPSFFV